MESSKSEAGQRRRLPVVLQPLLVCPEGGGWAVPHVVLELLSALGHGELGADGDTVCQLLVQFASF